MPPTASRPRRINFTKANIDALKLPHEGRTYTYDIKTPGLAICLTAAGSKVFYLYRKIGGKPERIRIGEWPQYTVDRARNEADRMNGRIADGLNPNDKRRVNRYSPTLGQVFEEYIVLPTRGKKKRPRSPKTTKDYRWQFEKHLAAWKDRQLSKIKRHDIEKLHNEIGQENGQYMANRILALVKAIFNYAVEQEYYPLNPAHRLAAYEEQSRERYLSADELPAFWKAVEAEEAADFYKLSLLTGARKGNVLAMQWSELDLAAATWKISRTKNGQPLTVMLAPAAVALLKARQKTAKGPWVFPNPAGTSPMAPPKHGWDRIREAAGVTDLRMHDLRRSLGSWQVTTGASETVIGRSLGHQSIQAAKIYARADQDAVRASVNKATDAILAAATAKPTKKQQPKGGRHE